MNHACHHLTGTRLHAAAACVLALLAGCGQDSPSPAMDDEAMKRALKQGVSAKDAARAEYYPKVIDDYFDGMDSIVPAPSKPYQLLTESDLQKLAEDDSRRSDAFPGPENPKLDQGMSCKSETLGRNTWMIWCGGNEGFWDWLATESLGFIDLLQLVDTRKRSERFATGGLINEPEMDEASAPASGEFGLWLDLPQDPALRAWRKMYVAQTFEKLRDGRHKSQIGLKKKGHSAYGGGVDLFRGNPQKDVKTGYDPPSSYRADSGAAQGDYGYRGNQEKSGYDDLDNQVPPPDIYGLSSGVVGLRLFPNPYFDGEAQKKWDANRFYTDKSYSSDPELIRPYRVGVSCAYCHASFHPLKPPTEVNHPEWSNISGSIGAQYLRIRVAFGNLLTKDQFIYHLLDSQPPGTIDTSLIASDNINNPNTMNAIFNLPERVLLSLRNPRETLSASSAELPSIWPTLKANSTGEDCQSLPESWRNVFESQGLAEEIASSNGNPRRTPRVLLDGSDSVGPWAALARVYLNIGSYWEQWNQLHQPVLGFAPQRPFRINDCETHSVYWNATNLRVGGLRDYFLKVTSPMPLFATRSGMDRIRRKVDTPPENATKAALEKAALSSARHVDVRLLERGRKVFAKNCIVCHSSIQPESSAFTLFPGADDAARQNQTSYEDQFEALIARRMKLRERDAGAGEFWEHDPGKWLRDPDYQLWAEEIVEKPLFWKSNYLSTDYRIPVTVVRTNSGRAMATNALTGHMWEDFASESYRSLPPPGEISYFDPYRGPEDQNATFTPRHRSPQGVPAGGGGPGYYRVPSLVSIWATAPFLHNNSLGRFTNDPSVDGRLDAFDDAIRKLLWPEKRLESSSYNEATPERLKRDHGLIWRTTQETTLSLASKRVPFFAKRLGFVSALYMRFPSLLEINPLWLPSTIFFAGSLLILLVSSYRSRGKWAFLVLVGAGLLWLLMIAASWYPEVKWLDGIRVIRPQWLPPAALLGLALTLLLPWSALWRRRVAYASVVAALLIGGIVYFNAGKLGDFNLGPIPKGTPVNLIANFNSEASVDQQVEAVKKTLAGLAEIESRHLAPDDANEVLKTKVAPALMAVNKCPDFVMDRGHYFEWFKTMTDDDKNALIELLKTF